MATRKSSGTKTYQIEKFKLNEVQPGMVSILIGKRHSGKGFFMKHLIYKLREQYAIIVVFSGSEAEDPFYKKFVAPCFVYETFDTDGLRRVVSAQRERVKALGINKRTNMALILDDLMDEDISKNKEIKQLFFQGRHWGVSLYLCLQYAISISPAMRTNTDFVFLFNEPIASNRANLYKHYVGICGSLKEFETLFKQLTQNFQVMVVRLSRIESDTIDANIFWYKAKKTDSFRAGAIETWQFYEKYSIERNRKKFKKLKHVQA